MPHLVRYFVLKKENWPQVRMHVALLAVENGLPGWSGPWEKKVWNVSMVCTYGRHKGVADTQHRKSFVLMHLIKHTLQKHLAS